MASAWARLSVVMGVVMGVGGVERVSEEVREAGRGAAARRLGAAGACEGARERSTGAEAPSRSSMSAAAAWVAVAVEGAAAARWAA